MKKGDRVELVLMLLDPDPIPEGTFGTVQDVISFEAPYAYDQVSVEWDNGRTLSLVIPPDIVRVLS